MLAFIDPTVPRSQREAYREVVERCMCSSVHINDRSDKLLKLTTSTADMQVGSTVSDADDDFGDDIRELASKLVPEDALQ